MDGCLIHSKHITLRTNVVIRYPMPIFDETRQEIKTFYSFVMIFLIQWNVIL